MVRSLKRVVPVVVDKEVVEDEGSGSSGIVGWLVRHRIHGHVDIMEIYPENTRGK